MTCVDQLSDSPVRTGELTEKVWNYFGAGYTRLTQVRAATGWADMNTADMMVMGEWPSTGNELHGFEIKVSRSDWLNEVKNPDKNKSVKSYCDRWWLVIADETMVKSGELPDDWGMMAFQGANRKLKIVKKAPKLDAQPLDHCFVASLLRHNDKESIPMDIHREEIRDAARDAKAFERRKSTELFTFVKEVAQGFGIKIVESKDFDYTKPGRSKIFSRWKAEIRGTYIGRLSAETLADMLRRVEAYDSMKSEVEIAQRRLQEIVAKGHEIDNPDYVLPWAEWALKSCSKILDGSTEAGDARDN